jgi:hypothetical protein
MLTQTIQRQYNEVIAGRAVGGMSVLEGMPEVVRYVKNHNLGFTIPYTLNGEERQYIPDFIACIDDGRGARSAPWRAFMDVQLDSHEKESTIAA